MKQEIDWLRLSNVETASGIEVLYAAKLFSKNRALHKIILKHALDEYRHSSIFRSYAKKYQKNASKMSSIQSLLAHAGLANSPFNPLDKNILKVCCYLYIGEYRAIDFNNQTKKLIKDDAEILNDLAIIEKDEEGHAEGVKRFLKTNHFYKYAIHLLLFKLRYFFQRATKAKLVNLFQSQASGFLAKHLFRMIPSSLFRIKNEKITLERALVESKRM